MVKINRGVLVLLLIMPVGGCAAAHGGATLSPAGSAAVKAATLDVLACGWRLALAEVLASAVGGDRPPASAYADAGGCYVERVAGRVRALRGAGESTTAAQREQIGREVATAAAQPSEDAVARCEATAAGALGLELRGRGPR